MSAARPPSRPMIGATTARSPRLSARKKKTKPPTSKHAREHGESEWAQVVVPGEAIDDERQRQRADAVADEDQERGDVRVDGAAERNEPVVGRRPGDGREQAEERPSCRGYGTGVVTAADPDAGVLASFLERWAPVVVLTGAGVSTASGLPDFRSPGGLWERLDPMVDGHVDMLTRDPARVWQCWAEPLIGAHIAPNPAHAALARLEASGVISGVVTQNIDGLHHAAGSEAVEVHGHLRSARCLTLRRRGGDGARARPLRGDPAARRNASSAAGRCGRRSCSSASRCPLRPGAARASSRRAPAAACASARRCRSTRRPASPRRSCGRRRPLAIVSRQPTELWDEADPRLLRSAEQLLPAVASILEN